MSEDWSAFAAEVIEAEPVPASGLVLTKCRGCGGPEVLAVPHMVPVAICDICRKGGVKIDAEPLERPFVQGLCCFPMPLREMLQARERSPHPAPEVTGKWTWDFVLDQLYVDGEPPIPAPVLALAEMARAAGWRAEVRYARGTGAHGGTGKPTSLRHSFAVRIGGHPLTQCEARAVYGRSVAGAADWTWASVWLFGPALPFFGWAGVTELKEWLRVAGAVREGWYADVRGLAEMREAARKAREKAKREAGAGRMKLKESGG